MSLIFFEICQFDLSNICKIDSAHCRRDFRFSIVRSSPKSPKKGVLTIRKLQITREQRTNFQFMTLEISIPLGVL